MNFIFQFGEFSDSNGSDWINTITTIVTSFGSAFIGAWAALKVYKNTVRDQKAKDEVQKNSLEVSKLKYLGFLMTDVFISINHLISTVDKLRSRVVTKPLEIPIFEHYPLSSLLIISEKINQEDYYHSSINQLKNDEVAEMFYIINTIARQDVQLTKNYDTQVTHIVTIQKSLPNELNQLKDLIGDFIRKVNDGTLKDKFYKDASLDLIDILTNLDSKHKLAENNSNQILSSSLEFFVKPVIDLLTPYAHIPELTSIVQKAYEVDSTFSGLAQGISSLIDSTDNQVKQIAIASRRLDLVSRSLRDFYFKNKTKGSPLV